ncbi:Uncharacterised protein family UPF0102 [Syntrophomonas zehnderi OL-4]|uniref:UPF0102 protein 2680 n=1 Tax=Syntrophomonas zehnderi OL-4 TaxID=690567 RepID=A0A0E4GDG4_9FIRM|nr:YraN family protein [Syntrophomonas zehnderi]CFY08331.1 Uncharacterised protein family UPF0102 [Syntrophomonas zehnderi OL-4]
MKKQLGRLGEEIAVRYLEKEGYKILARNYRNRYGELDVICIKKEVLVFVEVKTRRSNRYGSAEEAVTPKKIEHIKKVSLHYLADCHFKYKEIRFDVVSILMLEPDYRLNHIKAAF